MYKTTITAIGEMVPELLESGLLVVFNENSPVSLQEIVVLHTIETLSRSVKTGDMIFFSNQKYQVTAVGSQANQTLLKLGHCTFSFSGKSETLNPGWIEVKGAHKPVLKAGDCFEIRSSGKERDKDASKRSEDY